VRLGRGDIRGLLLVELTGGPAHGYELMRRLEESSGGAWSPSPGSVYPTLQMLQDEGLLSAAVDGGKKTYTLTATGRAQARAAAKAPRPWQQGEQPTGRYPLRDITHAVHAAAKQVGTEGSTEQIDKAVEILRATRQQLYRLLAED
jgi:DNA-binding PadR family transcriptional regulator